MCGLVAFVIDMEFLNKIGPLRLLGIGAAGIVVIALLVFLTLKLATPPMAVIYTNLSTEDSTLIISRLEAMNIPYKSGSTGQELLVPVSKVLPLRMQFAQEGIPSSGSIVGYEIFDKNDALGTSQFVYNVNYMRALEGELGKTIGSLAPIENARVHLVIPKKEMFAKNASEPTASVVLRVKGSNSLSKQEVSGISYLVATAVPGLKPENVTIIDNRGKPLKLGSSEERNSTAATESAVQFQHEAEARLKSVLEDMLEKSVGLGKVKATITAEINFDREVVNTEVFDPDGQVIRSKKTSEENDSEKEGGGNQVSADTNINAGGSDSSSSGARNKVRSDEITNYEISKTITNKVTETGKIKKLSIAVLVDGIYEPVLDEKGNVTELKYNPRTQEELDKIKILASSAVGLDTARGDKIEVINLQFSEEFATLPKKEKPFEWVQNQLQSIIQTVIVGIVIILGLLMVVRPAIIRALELRKVATEQSDLQEAMMSMQQINASQESPEQSAPEPEDDFEVTFTQDKRKINMIKQLNEMVEKHPEETVAIIRNWLYSID